MMAKLCKMNDHSTPLAALVANAPPKPFTAHILVATFAFLTSVMIWNGLHGHTVFHDFHGGQGATPLPWNGQFCTTRCQNIKNAWQTKSHAAPHLPLAGLMVETEAVRFTVPGGKKMDAVETAVLFFPWDKLWSFRGGYCGYLWRQIGPAFSMKANLESLWIPFKNLGWINSKQFQQTYTTQKPMTSRVQKSLLGIASCCLKWLSGNRSNGLPRTASWSILYACMVSAKALNIYAYSDGALCSSCPALERINVTIRKLRLLIGQVAFWHHPGAPCHTYT